MKFWCQALWAALHRCCPKQMCVQEAEEALNALHQLYFEALEALFRKHMPTFPGARDLTLVMLR